MNLRSGIRKIEQHGCLLVFPIQNRTAPASIWSAFYPRSRMRWEWDDGGDNRVAELWRLREELSRSGKVVYAKWFQGRATFFSKAAFPALLKALNPQLGTSRRVPGRNAAAGLGHEAHRLLTLLEDTSPLSTKQLKRAAGLEGRFHETEYQRALRELWQRLLIVGFGEVDDGAFPSLAMGATAVLFEELWKEAERLPLDTALAAAEKALRNDPPLLRFFTKLRKAKAEPKAASPKASPAAVTGGKILHSQLVAPSTSRRDS